MSKTLSDDMQNYETRTSHGYCCDCERETTALWERVGNKLSISCKECGMIYHEDDNKFNDNP